MKLAVNPQVARPGSSTRRRRRTLRVAAAITALGLVLRPTVPTIAIEPVFAEYGTGTLLHPLEEPTEMRLPACYDEGPCECRKNLVHIFAVNGLNPMCLGNFNGLCAYLKKQGFTNLYFGQLYTSHGFAEQIRELRSKEPSARVAVVGFSLGANYVRAIVNNLAKDGTQVDLLVYLGGDHVYNDEGSRPPNVARVVNVRSHGIVLTGGDLLFNGAELEGARNEKLDTRHILIPSRRQTVEMMLEEMLTLACFPTEEPTIELVPQRELLNVERTGAAAATAQLPTSRHAPIPAWSEPRPGRR